jgi:Zn-dependent M16 (insulinase) family peptidase
MKRLEIFLDRLPGSSIVKLQSIRHENARLILKNDFQIERNQLPSKTHFEMPFDVFYSGQCYQSVPYSHEDYPRYVMIENYNSYDFCFLSFRLLILSKLMFNKFLLREIREIGGAYGGGAYLRGNLFSFFSYR